jgi:hypothetical protein
MSFNMRIFLIVMIPVVMLSGLATPDTARAISVTIRNIPPTPHHAPENTSLADVAATIQLAADIEGWRPLEEEPGSMIARLRLRTHTAVVKIGFDQSKFWIDYFDSTNLGYDPDDLRKTKTRRGIKGPRIHKNFNKWVRQLADSIEDHMKTPRSAIRVEQTRTPSPIMIADELEKLDALRERGVLTQEEFDRQKAKLLAR